MSTSTHPLSQLPRHSYAMALGYLELPVFDLTVAVPYWSNRLATQDTPTVHGYLGGKGTPAEIKEQVERLLEQDPATKKNLTEEKLVRFMGKHTIGVDCSGLVFQMLTAFTWDLQTKTIDDIIKTTLGGNPKNHARFRTNADALTNDTNTRVIEKVSDIQIGDLIRMEGGKHVCFIVSLTPEKIIYLHSSRSAFVQNSGAHLGEIIITDSTKGLESQAWQELTRKGENFGKKFFNSLKGDGIRRAWWLMNV